MKIQQAIQNRGITGKIVRYGLRPLAWLVTALIVIWVIFWVYVVTHEESLKNRVSNAIHNKTRGDVKIGGLSVSFFRTFPMLSLQLTVNPSSQNNDRNLIDAKRVWSGAQI